VGLILYLAYVGGGLIQMAAFIDGMHLYFQIGTIFSIVIFIVSYSVPILGALFTAVFTYYGARYGWYWEWWQAAFLASPGIILSIAVFSVGGLMTVLQRRPK
jgi:hypothetical protein